ncbi:phosphatidylserine synthase-like isoform X1 [Scylla paramamosain]|uniref:phosphatidylserine synthase-like isoform X1 n=1 Tax=Scylla paramamosain TaxID=85552 RepID=UPI0030832ABB
MASRRRTYSSGSDASDRFISINERPVDDISLEFFYKSHTITLLIVIISGLIYFAFTRDENESIQSNIQAGLVAMVFFFLIISIMAFPNGPFTRPHPAVWRIVFGLSILYMLLLLFIIFQDYRTVRSMFEWLFPELKNFTIDMDKGEWGEKCDDLSLSRLWESIDFFCFAHFAGWAMKTLLVRHYGILWTISVMWEITEIAFSHLLPNFIECWWDAIILDVLLCNGFGIWFGMQVCHLMEMRYYNWESIKDIQTTTGKLKRAVLQFTPESWTAMRWLDPACTYMRFLAVSQLVVFWQLSELNTFFLKHIFQMPPSHPLVFIRIFLLGAMSAPTIRQYYSYVTDPRCKRVGTQCWVYGLCMCIESLICIKFGADIFQHTQIRNIILWILVQAAMSVMCVYVCVTYHRWQRRRQIKKDDSVDDETEVEEKVNSYIQSLPRKTVTLSTPEDEDSDDEGEDAASKVPRRRKNHHHLRRGNRFQIR